MDFDSPEVMKTFPGLYAAELNKNNESDYSDENDKAAKKDSLLKRKEKKDKKDKERGYAALEGESSGDENGTSKSPSKTKKSKSFKFTTKSKEKREKSREKDTVEPKKDKDKKSEKKLEKEKSKGDKSKKLKHSDESLDIAETLPVFGGVSIETAVEFAGCHDGIDIPLPLRECIDHIESFGITFEGVYKVSGTKSKALHIKKLYNQRQPVTLTDYDIPTVCSAIKMFLRELPEPLFTNDLLVRFEEAGAILSPATREKHLRILLESLPLLNRTVLAWVIVHLSDVATFEKQNKMTKQSLSGALHHSLHCSPRLLNMLLNHSEALFPGISIEPYVPPLSSTSALPDEPRDIEKELNKQESLLNQIHKEMNFGCISKQREELLWEVQRIITQLKRTLKNANKDRESFADKRSEEKVESGVSDEKSDEAECAEEAVDSVENNNDNENSGESSENLVENSEEVDLSVQTEPAVNEEPINDEDKTPIPQVFDMEKFLDDNLIELMVRKNKKLVALKESLMNSLEKEYAEIDCLKKQLDPARDSVVTPVQNNDKLDEIIDLIQKENQILKITKINLVRLIIEEKESCIDLKTKLEMLTELKS